MKKAFGTKMESWNVRSVLSLLRDHCQALHAYTETESRTAHLHDAYYQQKLRNGTL